MKKLIIFFLLAGLLASGCSIKFGGKKNDVVAGVFKSHDRGQTWAVKNLLLHSGGTANMIGVDVIGLSFDPQDNKAIYLRSLANGLFYSYDGANSWMKAGPLGDKKINSVAIDPENKCVIYATISNTIVKSIDCNRSWDEVYIDTRSKNTLTALAIDSYNNLIIYAGNNIGEIFKSTNGGGNWQTIKTTKNEIKKILIDPHDTRIVYVATASKGIYKTVDSGATWFTLNDGLKPYSGALEFKDLIFDPTEANSLLLVAKYGLLKTADGGENWEPLKLITPPASIDIYGAAINSKNNREIIYSTKTTFYRTTDGGNSWVTKRLPSGATATVLLFDPADPNIAYMGLRDFNKK